MRTNFCGESIWKKYSIELNNYCLKFFQKRVLYMWLVLQKHESVAGVECSYGSWTEKTKENAE